MDGEVGVKGLWGCFLSSQVGVGGGRQVGGGSAVGDKHYVGEALFVVFFVNLTSVRSSFAIGTLFSSAAISLLTTITGQR